MISEAELRLAFLLGVAHGMEVAGGQKKRAQKRKAPKRVATAPSAAPVYGYGTCSGCNDDEVRLYSVGNERLCRECKP